MEKREAAKGIKDVTRLAEEAADDEEKQILEACKAKLPAKARGALPPLQRKEDALLAMASAQARLKRASTNLEEAQAMQLRAAEMPRQRPWSSRRPRP